MENGEVNFHHICVKCGRPFIDVYSPPKGYSNEVKENINDRFTKPYELLVNKPIELVLEAMRSPKHNLNEVR
jgi:hypothetical protein